MPWVRFVDDFDWRPSGKAVVAFKRGMTLFVTRAAADASIARGRAVAAERPVKESADARG